MTANVFAQDLRIGFKSQQVWGLPHAVEFFFLGAGAGLYLFATWLVRLPAGQLGALGLIMIAGAALVADLGKPTRLWRSMANLETSWISRGALAVFLFVGAAVLGLFLGQAGAGDFAFACEAVASLCAVVAMLYPGLVLSSYASIPAWNSPMIPWLFFMYSCTTGVAAFWLAQLLAADQAVAVPSAAAGSLLLAVTLLSLLVYLGAMARGSVAVRESLAALTHGPLSVLFVGAVVGAGLVLPLVVLIVAAFSQTSDPLLLGLASLLIFGGGFGFRYCVLKAGIYPPLF